MSTPLLTVLAVVPAVAVVIAWFVVMWRARTTPATARAALAAGAALAGWALAVTLRASTSLRSVLTTQQHLTRLNLWRLEGIVFLLLMADHQMPALWAWPAGVGDIAIGAAAF
jgi:hypothetical protein